MGKNTHLSHIQTYYTIIASIKDHFKDPIPNDIWRKGSFEPEMVKKRQTILNESLYNKVLAPYAFGMRYEAISEH